MGTTSPRTSRPTSRPSEPTPSPPRLNTLVARSDSPSTSTNLASSAAEALVIPHLLGGASSAKWAPSSSSLAKAIESIEGSQVRSYSSTYSDASLLSIEIQAEGSKRLTEAATKVVEAVKALGKSKISDEKLKAAVAKAKFDLAAASETSTGVVQLAAPMLSAGKVVP